MTTYPIKSMDHLPDVTASYPIFITTYDNAGNTLHKYQMDIPYKAQPITFFSFDFMEAQAYSGLSQLYKVSFTNSQTTLSNYPFIRFILNNDMIFSDPPQFNANAFTAFN